MKSDVYYAAVESSDLGQRSEALSRLLDKAGPLLAYKKGELVPVKMTLGDSQCIYQMRPELAKLVISKIKESKAKPFLFDTNVIYTGQRQNAVDHLTLAQNKGFHHSKVGAPFIIADGLLGQDGREFETGSKNIKKIKTPSFVGMLDSLVVLSHSTGHVFSGYAGAIKNVAMGMSCRATKQVQHSSMKPSIIAAKCTSCSYCMRVCPVEAITFDKKSKAFIDQRKCVGCGECLCACQFDAVFVNWEEDVDVFCQRMCEVAKCILSKFKNKFFITFAFDITQECDCMSTKNDELIGPNIGILASKDILSLNQAVVDLIKDDRHFLAQHDAYKRMFKYAQEIDLGSLDYNLVRL